MCICDGVPWVCVYQSCWQNSWAYLLDKESVYPLIPIAQGVDFTRHCLWFTTWLKQGYRWPTEECHHTYHTLPEKEHVCVLIANNLLSQGFTFGLYDTNVLRTQAKDTGSPESMPSNVETVTSKTSRACLQPLMTHGPCDIMSQRKWYMILVCMRLIRFSTILENLSQPTLLPMPVCKKLGWGVLSGSR